MAIATNAGNINPNATAQSINDAGTETRICSRCAATARRIGSAANSWRCQGCGWQFEGDGTTFVQPVETPGYASGLIPLHDDE
jgi:ribosomal protein L37AE/L43A